MNIRKISALLSLILILAACSRKAVPPGNCMERVKCFYSQYSYQTADLDQDGIPEFYNPVKMTAESMVSVCEKDQWIASKEREIQAERDSASDTKKRFLLFFPASCGCEK